MKKFYIIMILTVLLNCICLFNVYAFSAEEFDLYNHQYYPYSVNNGGIRQIQSDQTGDFWVNPATGALNGYVIDFTLPGRNGFDLTVARRYNSFDSNLYEPYVCEVEQNVDKAYYRVKGKKDFEKYDIHNTLVDSGTGVDVCINAKYYDYTTPANKYENLTKFEFDENEEKLTDLFESENDANSLRDYLNTTNIDIDSTNPNSSVGYYYANYYDFVVETVIVNTKKTLYDTALLPDTSRERYSMLGAGWEFDFPYIEIRYGNDNYEMLHYGEKGVWEIDTSNNNGLSGYPINDIILTIDRTVNCDGKKSKYCVTEKDGKKCYFGEDGRLLLMKDRFGNQIKFDYDIHKFMDTNGKRQSYPYLVGIEDSVGRIITFEYGSEYETNDGTYQDIILTLSDPTNEDNILTSKYVMKKIENISNTVEMIDSDEYNLVQYVDFAEESQIYRYSTVPAQVSFFERNKDFVDYYYDWYSNYEFGNSYIDENNWDEIIGQNNYFSPMLEYTDKSGRTMEFKHSRFLKNCTPTGSMVFLKAYYICSDVMYDENGEQYEVDKHEYKYPTERRTEYDGYPSYKIREKIPDTFRYIIKDIFNNQNNSNKDITNTHIYKYIGENENLSILKKEYITEAVDNKESIEYVYDENTLLVTNKTTRKYNNPDDTSYMEFTEAYTYDENLYGDVLSIIPNSDTDRMISYVYNNTYHYPIQKTYKQNSQKTIKEEYIPTTDGKSVQTKKIYENNVLKKKNDYTYDSYGNLISQKEYTGDNNSFIKIDFSYDDSQYDGQFDGANLTRESVVVKDIENIEKNISTNYAYDWLGNIISFTDGENNTTGYEYDSLNRVIKKTNADNTHITFEYHLYGDGIEITTTDELGTNIIDYYDSSNCYASSALESWDMCLFDIYRNEFNNVIKEVVYGIGGITSIVKYDYDTAQRPLYKEISSADGTIAYKETYNYHYTPNYWVKTTVIIGDDTTPSIEKEEYYDVYGNKFKEVIGTDVQTYEYDYAGNIVSSKSPNVNALNCDAEHTYEYDYMGNIISETNELDVTLINEFDALGNMIKSYDAYGNVSEYKYDELGRLIEQKIPFEEKNGVIYYSIKKIWYDGNGKVVKECTNINAPGESEEYNEIKYTYDCRNRLVMTETNDGNNSYYTQNYYDAKGNLLCVYTGLTSPIIINGKDDITVSDDNEYSVIKYEYDEFGNPVKFIDSMGLEEKATYDLNGNMLTSTDKNGETLMYSYNALNNWEYKTFENSYNESMHREFGVMGELLSLWGSGIIDYKYDNRGRIIEEKHGDIIKTYTYDSNGNRLTFSVTGTDINMSMSYTYDLLNRLTSVSKDGAIIVSYDYDNKNNRIQTSVPGGETTYYQYNIANLLTEQVTGDKLNEQYTYYLNGNQKSKSANGDITEYEYDDMNRLIRENNVEYTFDDFGNRHTMQNGDLHISYMYDLNNRLIQSVETSPYGEKSNHYVYDNNGNMILKSCPVLLDANDGQEESVVLSERKSNQTVDIYEYNRYNQLVKASVDGTEWKYNYYPDGMRYSKSYGEVLTFENEDQELIVDNGEKTTRFVYDNGDIIAETFYSQIFEDDNIEFEGLNLYYRGYEIVKNNEGVYFNYNGQGDVAFLTDESGETVADYSYDAYGNLAERNLYYNPFGYRGEYTDAETGLVYLRNRYYAPELGRFLTQDPIKDGLNWYAYCENNPVNFVDPWGLTPSKMESALMSDHVYDHNWDDPINDRRIYDVYGNYTGWRMIDEFVYGTSKIGVYVRGDGRDKLSTYTGPMEYVLAFKGTEPTCEEDWINNIQQFKGEYSEHLVKGLAYTSRFVKDWKDCEISFTGHSKGGGEAAVNAEFWDKNAIVFNPSVPDITWSLADDSHVESYVVNGEILNNTLGEIPLGNTTYLNVSFFDDAIEKHGMNAVIAGLIIGGYK